MGFTRPSVPAVLLALAGSLVFAAAALALAERPGAATRPATAPAGPFASLDDDHLHNGHRVTDKVLSGAQPEGEASFKALKDLGVKSIISVDGSKPDVATAAKYGIRYVHLPITYSTVTPEQGRAIAKAIDELPGPIYLHCHHGKHRSAAAVAVACVYNGSLKPEQAESVLKTFGTGDNYKGLWKAAREARPMDPQELGKVKVDLVPQAKIPPMAEGMVFVDRHWDHLKLIRKNNWQVPADHPALDPAHEALQLQEHLHEMGRTDDVKARPEGFRRMLLDGETGSQSLREALAAKPVNPAAAEAAFATVARSCVECHKAYRD